ncbi:hypothetical protein LDENG_00226570 [Lucifuga dentata]|nr:hypothetical protein LDENG_00226570 [Lucifuga dentata]
MDVPTVSKVFGKLHTRKATGPDGISAFLLKTFAEELSPAWCPLYQLSIDLGSIPTIWKRAIVTPVPKKPSSWENNDFRPVAVTSVVMKSLERIIVGRLRDDVNSVLDPYQLAYKNNRNTSDALNIVSHLILKHLENRTSYVRLLFIDFSSAFNTMLPQVLLGKLKQMEVNPYIIKWYHSFLVDRQQQVKVNSTLSELQTISVGAPQGCISSPLLFTLYMLPSGSIFKKHGVSFHCYTEDSQIYLPLKRKTTILLKALLDCLDDIKTWMALNFLDLSEQKTEVMMFGPPELHATLCGDLCPLGLYNKPSVKNLGVSFRQHSSVQ